MIWNGISEEYLYLRKEEDYCAQAQPETAAFMHTILAARRHKRGSCLGEAPDRSLLGSSFDLAGLFSQSACKNHTWVYQPSDLRKILILLFEYSKMFHLNKTNNIYLSFFNKKFTWWIITSIALEVGSTVLSLCYGHGTKHKRIVACQRPTINFMAEKRFELRTSQPANIATVPHQLAGKCNQPITCWFFSIYMVMNVKGKYYIRDHSVLLKNLQKGFPRQIFYFYL